MSATTPLLAPFCYCPHCGSARFVDNNAQSKRCLDCGLIYYINPKAAVVALITNDEGDILVCRRAKKPASGTLDLPGGFTDLDETAEEAAWPPPGGSKPTTTWPLPGLCGAPKSTPPTSGWPRYAAASPAFWGGRPSSRRFLPPRDPTHNRFAPVVASPPRQGRRGEGSPRAIRRGSTAVWRRERREAE